MILRTAIRILLCLCLVSFVYGQTQINPSAQLRYFPGSQPYVSMSGQTATGMMNQQPGGNAPVWNRMGVVINPVAANCGTGNIIQEKSVLYEGNARILSGNVFKMWFHAGIGGATSIYYAESKDGLAWSCYSGNPIINAAAGYTMPRSILKSGGTYILYLPKTNWAQIDRLTSPDGLTWTKTNSSVLTVGGAGQWDHNSITNPTVWFEDSTHWYLLYSANPSIPNQWEIGLATSVDGITWIKSPSNPVIPHATGSCAIYKSNAGNYYCWTQQAPADNSVLPSDIGRWSSPDLVNWTQSPVGNVFTRATADEGANNPAGQVADPAFITTGSGLGANSVDGKVFMYYEALRDQQNVGPFPIKLAIANMGFEQLITTNEGGAPTPWPDASNAVVASPLNLPSGTSIGVGFEPGVAGYFTCGDLTISTTTSVDICNWGLNSFMQTSGLRARGSSSVSGPYFEMRSGTNAQSYLRAGIIETGGADRFGFGWDMTAGGAANQFYMNGSGFCMNSTGPGACNDRLFSFGLWSGTSLRRFGLGSVATGTAGILHTTAYIFQEAANPCSGITAGQSMTYQDSTTHQVLICNNGSTTAVPLTQTIGSGTSTTNGTAISSGTSQSQPAITITGVTTSDVAQCSLNAAPDATWQTGIQLLPAVVTANTVTLWLSNPTANSITPVASVIRCKVVR